MLLRLQEKAESFAHYKQQLSIGLNVLVTLLSAAVVGYALGRHFIDVNNKAGVSRAVLDWRRLRFKPSMDGPPIFHR